MHEAAAVSPSALTLRVEAAHRLRLEALFPRVAPFFIGQLAFLQLLLFPNFFILSLGSLVYSGRGLNK